MEQIELGSDGPITPQLRRSRRFSCEGLDAGSWSTASARDHGDIRANHRDDTNLEAFEFSLQVDPGRDLAKLWLGCGATALS